MKDIMEKLQAPFSQEDIEWRVQRAIRTRNGDKAIVAAYVTNRAIMNRLDQVVGVNGWKNEYKEWRAKGVLCGLSIKLGDEWITKWDGAEETNIEGVKGGLSGSMKRAAVQFGIGRYLYNLDETRVDIRENGDNYINSKVKNGNKDEWVTGRWNSPQLPNWALPENERGQQRHSEPNSQSSQYQQPNTNNDAKPATKSQIDCIDKIAIFVAEARNITKDKVLQELKNRLNFTNSNDLTFEGAASAIQLLNEWKKGGNN